MLRREDMMELTRRMTPSRSSIDRIAGCYFDEEGYVDGTFNTSFLNLSVKDKEKNLQIARAVPFSETNRQLVEMDFPGETRESGDMMRLMDAMMECGLKNDALLETFYEVVADRQPKGRPFALYLFHGVYDIPRKGTDKAEQWESEEVYEYLICTLSPVSGEYVTGDPYCGFLYPSFYDRSADIFHIDVFEREPEVSGAGLIEALGCL
ncbi:MAG: DUF4317 family protein [Lachnospiraceae bacterium]|nr:DUF4317 family protein [Lachnospiraceae bacterium]